MKQLLLYILLLTTISLTASFSVVAGEKVSFNKEWKFIKETSTLDYKTVSNLSFDATNWEAVTLPHTANIEPLVVNNQWQGIAWYRKTFSFDETKKDKKFFVEFEGAMNSAEVWVNGQFVKKHIGGYLPFVFDISPYITFGKENCIVVRLDNNDSAVTGPKPLKILDFNTFGGLYRNAWLMIKEPLHITNAILENKVAGGGIFVTYPEVSDKKAVIAIQTDIKNQYNSSKNITIVQELRFKNKLVSRIKSELILVKSNESHTSQQSITLKNPKLWNTNTPHLYTLITKVMDGKKSIDKEVTKIGIKHIGFAGRDFYLNGEKRYLRGVNRHQEYPYIGYALSKNAEVRDAIKIKNAGFDVVRLSHYPHSPSFMDACDSLGLLTLDAILGWQYYKPTTEFRNQIFQTARDLIRRDRNHASVIAWEVSLNETKMPLEFRQKLSTIAHEEYPTKQSFSAGWMNEGYDIYLQARQHRILHPEAREEWKGPYFVSEYGDWEYYSKNAGLNQHQLDKTTRYETSSRQARGFGEKRLLMQAYNVQEALNDNLSTEAFGDGYWVMFDYNRGYHDDLELSGISDLFRIEKFAYYFYQSQRTPTKQIPVTLKIASYWTDKSPLSVKVYSNCDEVAFYLNNKLVAKQKPDQDKKAINLPHPPFTFQLNKFEKGTLKAIGYIDGKVVETAIVKTPESVDHLVIEIDESEVPLAKNTKDVVFAYIKVVDKNGTLVPNYNKEIELKIKGNISLMNKNGIITEAGIGTAVLQFQSLKEGLQLQATSDNGRLKGSYQLDVK
ncbi:glycoside hydrolase family 2 protein [Flammeovirga pectinis]|uniref:Glycoside hydrolase family 2 protein n=1 Tax=Flammeovirga pectinis TaxID=2494373 RepID=A0A3S9P6D2_9BACT|nr:sugar-binding domain-containing protein [Flammeovirga pectinis]AZQ63779.1 glycoside hydrolase family 2 protein [Flammeovirga pectinis]